MTDHELGLELVPSDPLGMVGCWLVSHMPPAKRASYEALVLKSRELMLYESGIGPRPTGLIICGERQIRMARGSRATTQSSN